MNRLFFKKVMISILFVLGVQFGFAQKTFQLQANPELKITGTSTLHDWEMLSSTANGTMNATETDGKLTQIELLKITMPAESVKSGKKAMDKKAHNAMKVQQHKNVIFTLKSASKSADFWTLTGTFAIAGTTKQVSLKAKEVKSGSSYALSGEYAFKLTDYGVTPPTFMGAVKTGDDVKIHFNVKFK